MRLENLNQGPFGDIIKTELRHEFELPTEQQESLLHGWAALDPFTRRHLELVRRDGRPILEVDEPLSTKEQDMLQEHVDTELFHPVPGTAIWTDGDFYLASSFKSEDHARDWFWHHQEVLPRWLKTAAEHPCPLSKYVELWFEKNRELNPIRFGGRWWQYRTKMMRSLARQGLLPYDSFLSTESELPGADRWEWGWGFKQRPRRRSS